MPSDDGTVLSTRGLISHIQRFSIHDGPGIRTTVFMMGCPLSCAWCHNPETRSRHPKVYTLRNRCIGCGSCISVCPEHLGNSDVSTPESCRLCGDCIRGCPTGARNIAGIHTAPEKLMDIIARDLPFYEQSGGGVTFSGGEPLDNPEFLLECLRLCSQNKVHTVVDTSGYCPTDIFETIVPSVDLLLYDLKLMEDVEHRRWTGVSVYPILDNLTLCASHSIPVQIRIPLIPGVTMTDSNIAACGNFIASIADDWNVELLPFHNLGDDKARRMGLPGQKSFRSPEQSEIDHTAGILRDSGVTVLPGFTT